jgi:hypothetical protein
VRTFTRVARIMPEPGHSLAMEVLKPGHSLAMEVLKPGHSLAMEVLKPGYSLAVEVVKPGHSLALKSPRPGCSLAQYALKDYINIEYPHWELDYIGWCVAHVTLLSRSKRT